MFLGQKSQRIISPLGVKSSTPCLSLGVKSYSPQLDIVSLIKSHTPYGTIRNESNSNNMHREPILGVKLKSDKVKHNNNNLEKATRIRHPNKTNSKFH